MPQQLQDIIRRVRSKLNEPAYPTAPPGQQTAYNLTATNTGQRFYTDTELTDWVNDACRDIARRSEDLQTISTALQAMVGVQNYALPSDVIRVNRVEFQPTGSTQVYPVELRTRNEVDSYIGFNPTIQSSWPKVAWIWGTPNSAVYPLTMSFYPVFSTAGIISIWYFRMPVRLADPVANAAAYQAPVDTVEGWDDLVVNYTLAKAYAKAKNPDWQTHQQEYETQLISLVEVSRQWHNQPTSILDPRRTSNWSMDWLWGTGGEW